jgi:hypothetical protein
VKEEIPRRERRGVAAVKELEREHARLKRMKADHELEVTAIKDVLIQALKRGLRGEPS